MNKGVFSGKGTLTHSAHTVTPHSQSAPPLIINRLWTLTSKSQYQGASATLEALYLKLHEVEG